MRMKQYKIVSGYTSVQIERIINASIKRGWQPIGGISVVSERGHNAPNAHYYVYFQALYK